MKRHIKSQKIGYPVLFDAGGRMNKELIIDGLPVAFLVGTDGKVMSTAKLAYGGWKKLQALIENHKKPRSK